MLATSNSHPDYHFKIMHKANLTLNHLQRFFYGTEKSNNVMSLLTLLVTLIHLYAVMWFLAPEENFTPPEPMPMEVSLINIAAPKPVQPTPPEPKPVIKPVLKPVQQAVIKKPAQIVQNSPDFAPPSDAPPPSPPPSAAAPSSSESAPAPTFVEANFKANYLSNPKPEYPAIAKSRGWQGKVMLRVQVSAEGTALNVAVESSSGHEMLDESAVEAVNKWKFIPAKRGDTAVISTVIVPIIFTLRD
ncbi:MAG: energy transducer TonB [Methylococcaceae bacterium]|nr:energy transducer TonB [Methylococcaceae bacterium]